MTFLVRSGLQRVAVARVTVSTIRIVDNIRYPDPPIGE
jgi:hypothetical protein